MRLSARRFIQTLVFEKFFTLNEIRRALIEEEYPPETWGYLCQLTVEYILLIHRFMPHPVDNLNYVRRALLKNNFPADAIDGGIDYWITVRIIEYLKNAGLFPVSVANFLIRHDFSYKSSLRALNHFYTLIKVEDKEGVILVNDKGEIQELVCWPRPF